MTAKRVPLFLGEGPDRILIGTATVDGANINCEIDNTDFRKHFHGPYMYSLGIPPKEADFQWAVLRDLSKENLPRPIYKETPVADELIKPKPIQDRINRAINMVVAYFNSHAEKTDDFELTADHVYVVWFNSTLNNWKAMVSTTVPDGMYYEVTYNWSKRETYVDAYKKFKNICVRDEDIDPDLPLPVSFTPDEFLAGKPHPDDITLTPEKYPVEWRPSGVDNSGTVQNVFAEGSPTRKALEEYRRLSAAQGIVDDRLPQDFNNSENVAKASEKLQGTPYGYDYLDESRSRHGYEAE